MSILRREFSAGLLCSAAAPALLGLSGPAWAQGAPVEGRNYITLSQPLATPGGGKIEVIEFFWYGCPHCNAFEPTLEAWTKKLPADVAFRRVPVALREAFVVHQRIFYALEAMGQLEAMHRKVFYAIHNPNASERQLLEKTSDIVAFMVKNGLDGAKFTEVFGSFTVQTKARQANQLADGYKIDGVPALGVHGRWFTSGSLAGGHERMLGVVDYLVQRVRKNA